jgi:hypothetical protein
MLAQFRLSDLYAYVEVKSVVESCVFSATSLCAKTATLNKSMARNVSKGFLINRSISIFDGKLTLFIINNETFDKLYEQRE